MVYSADASDDAYVLSIGAIYGGPEFSHQPDVPWKAAVQSLMQRIVDVRQGVESPLNVNVVFHVPGSVLTPEFTGSRTGSFRKRDSHLIVQIALPPEAPDDQAAYLISSIRDSIETVEVWNRRKDRQFDLSALRSVVDHLQAGAAVQQAHPADGQER
ncbi:MAG: hypothetical protein ACYC77_11865 [Coriobacteriia bacterium]